MKKQFDIAIIGSGIAGSVLASILAKRGKRVVVFEAKSHPRFAIGESMILETSEVMRSLAELYEIPELAYFSSENYFKQIGTQHGVKRHFSYLHHSEGETHDHRKTLQAVIPKEPHGHEVHLYRQDVDSFFSNIAVSYGATVLQNTPVSQIDFGNKSVTIATRSQNYSVDYVVDASGFKSPLAEKFNLRDFNLKTHSRAIFTHMIDLKCIHETGVRKKEYALPFKLSEGTLHHVFEGGWLWVIPFNNHKQSTNPLCSVGLMLDPRVHPKQDDLSAEEEFNNFIERFPSIAAQFEGAKAVRSWTRTGRIQYSSKQVVGNRWALLGHAAGFIDPLYSKGLYSSLTSVSVLANLLLEPDQDYTQEHSQDYTQDYSREKFMELERKTLAFIKTNDQLVANSYKAFSNYRLWQGYSVLWMLGAYTELVKLISARVRSHNKDQYYTSTQSLTMTGGGFSEFETLARQIDRLLETVDSKDETQVSEAAQQIKLLIASIDWAPKAFIDVLNGKNHLPRHKLRLRLLGQNVGFMGSGSYKEHFFGETKNLDLLRFFFDEQVRYSKLALNLQRY